MNNNIKKANRVKIETICRNLEKRNMLGCYCENTEEACRLCMQLLEAQGAQEGRTRPLISWGGSVTIDEIGLRKKLFELAERCEADVIDPFAGTPDEAWENKRKALCADTFFMSTNAITMDGKLMNIDGTGNRLAGLLFGPKQVVVIAGVNKIVLEEKDALGRILTDACPPNCVRLGKKTACALTGRCSDCLVSGQTSCCNIVTTRFCSIPQRVKVLLVNENLGF